MRLRDIKVWDLAVLIFKIQIGAVIAAAPFLLILFVLAVIR